MSRGIRGAIMRELDGMTDAQLEEALNRVRQIKGGELRGVPADELIARFAGTLSKEDADDMMRAIEEGCEQIEWERWDLPSGHERGNRATAE